MFLSQTRDPLVRTSSESHTERTRARQENVQAQEPLKPEISYVLFWRIFRTDFNLGFRKPKSDTCSRCDSLNIVIKEETDREEKSNLEKERDDHQDNAQLAYDEKKKDKKDAIVTWSGKRRLYGGVKNKTQDCVDVITFDFQQNLETPSLRHNDMFYLWQLWTYNFGIHDCVQGRGYMHVWSETTAKRGSAEVVSCLEKNF